MIENNVHEKYYEFATGSQTAKKQEIQSQAGMVGDLMKRYMQKLAVDKSKYKEELKYKNKTAAERTEIKKDIERINLMEEIFFAEMNGNAYQVPKMINT